MITGSLTAKNGAEQSTNDEQTVSNEYTYEEIIVESYSDEEATDDDEIAIKDVNSPDATKRTKGSTMKSLQLGMGQSIQFNMNVKS